MVSFNPETMKRLVKQDALLIKMFNDLSQKHDEDTALEVLFNSEVLDDVTYEELYLELSADTTTDHPIKIPEMSLIDGFAKAFSIIKGTGRCTFNPEQFGTAWDDIANGVIETLEGFKCDVQVLRHDVETVVKVLD